MKGLVLDLKMRDKQGSTVTDYSRYGNDGAVNGDVVWTEHGMRFDGSTGYLDCGSDASLGFGSGNFAISAWIKIDTHAKSCIVGKDAAGQRQFFLMYDPAGSADNNLQIAYFKVVDDAVYLNSDANPITDNDWHHIIGQRNGNSFDIYMDGNNIKSGTTIGIHGIMQTETVDLQIGARVYGTSRSFFDGNIDQVRIYNRALPLREIKAMYNAGKHKYV